MIESVLRQMLSPNQHSAEDWQDLRQDLWVLCLVLEPRIVDKESPMDYLFISLKNKVQDWNETRQKYRQRVVRLERVAEPPLPPYRVFDDLPVNLDLKALERFTRDKLLPELLARDPHNLLYLKAMGDKLLRARDLLALGLPTEEAQELLPWFRGPRRDRFAALALLFDALGQPRRGAETFRKRVEKAENIVLLRLGRLLGMELRDKREAVAEFWAWYFRQRSTRL